MQRFHELTLTHAFLTKYNSNSNVCKKCSTCSYFVGCYAFQRVLIFHLYTIHNNMKGFLSLVWARATFL